MKPEDKVKAMYEAGASNADVAAWLFGPQWMLEATPKDGWELCGRWQPKQEKKLPATEDVIYSGVHCLITVKSDQTVPSVVIDWNGMTSCATEIDTWVAYESPRNLTRTPDGWQYSIAGLMCMEAVNQSERDAFALAVSALDTFFTRPALVYQSAEFVVERDPVHLNITQRNWAVTTRVNIDKARASSGAFVDIVTTSFILCVENLIYATSSNRNELDILCRMIRGDV
jgi:hypothetical protein